MAKDKERSINPAQQARKQEKNRAIKKSKNEQQARRNEKLVRQNPDRIQRQIDDLKALESSGEIKPREKAALADLERDLRAVKKAREALGEKAPTFGNDRRPRNDQTGRSGSGSGNGTGTGVLGKRGRDGEPRPKFQSHDRDSDSGEETDESVRNIPMPRDTPPPVPREFRRNTQRQRYHHQNPDADNSTQSLPRTNPPPVEHKTTYSSAPQLRDLQKEATSRFIPSTVKRKQDAVKGIGGTLLEPEELDKLEAAGYKAEAASGGKPTSASNAPEVDDAEARRLADELARFEREVAAVEAMDVDDEVGDQSASLVSRPSKSRHVEIEDVHDEDL